MKTKHTPNETPWPVAPTARMHRLIVLASGPGWRPALPPVKAQRPIHRAAVDAATIREKVRRGLDWDPTDPARQYLAMCGK